MNAPSEMHGPACEASEQPESVDDQRSVGGVDRAFGPRTNAECLVLLAAVLDALDDERPGRSRDTGETVSLAAAHVQQAIELIQTIEEGDA